MDAQQVAREAMEQERRRREAQAQETQVDQAVEALRRKRCRGCHLTVSVTHETNGEECRDFQWERFEKARD